MNDDQPTWEDPEWVPQLVGSAVGFVIVGVAVGALLWAVGLL